MANDVDCVAGRRRSGCDIAAGACPNPPEYLRLVDVAFCPGFVNGCSACAAGSSIPFLIVLSCEGVKFACMDEMEALSLFGDDCGRPKEYCLLIRQASSRASENSRTLGKRFCGSFSSARIMTFSTSTGV